MCPMKASASLLVLLVSAYPAKILGCPGKADIIALIDGSSSIEAEVFQKELDLVSKVAKSLVLGDSSMQIAALTYGFEVFKLFDFKDTSDLSHKLELIASATKPDTSTYTHKALDFVRKDRLFSAERGARSSASKIVVVVSDGRSNYLQQALLAANRLKQQGVTIMAVGKDATEVQMLASTTDDAFVVQDFSQTADISGNLVRRICKVASP